MRILFTIFLFAVWNYTSYSQTQFWSDTFEDVGAPSSGTRTPSVTFYASTERYYDRVTTAQVNTTTTYSGFQGSKFWGGADVDNITGQNTQSPFQNITWSSINISGRTNMSFKGLFAIGNTSNFDHFPGSSSIDHMIVEYRIDGGAWINLVRFFPNLANNGSGALALETTGDSLAQGEGAALNGTFAEFTANITGTGSLLDLRFKSENNGTSFEEISIDNFRLLTNSGLPVKLVDFYGTTSDKKNILSWTTATEESNDRFEIEKSIDGITFEKIGAILGRGTSNNYQYYSFTDHNFMFSKLYYRLKQVDIDGRFEYSKIISINVSPKLKIDLYPNPVSNSLTIELNEQSLPNSEIYLFNISGKLLPIRFGGTGFSRKCNIEQLPIGAYIIKVNLKSGLQTKLFYKK